MGIEFHLLKTDNFYYFVSEECKHVSNRQTSRKGVGLKIDNYKPCLRTDNIN